MSTFREPDLEVNRASAVLARWSVSLSNLLRTNLPPSEYEANLRETELSDAYDALEELDQEIEHVQTTLSSLKSERKAHHRSHPQIQDGAVPRSVVSCWKFRLAFDGHHIRVAGSESYALRPLYLSVICYMISEERQGP
ncbi:uncharacterized protein EV420DRAFT_1642997 [Desarmillaria tabescens]|uniref:Uncharacterized protein n=1 Tax=Armillaria tabescens TaxID=1929756 RepID=A0AA39KCV3_ARMTA|nr:uncharacterized protein EV420DRAFT_1642997 [Desarmillaria tabescens]KAK0458652.1 hypothetical protein EV420DRAFT_1642997 [Desarmillaria tabescens]